MGMIRVSDHAEQLIRDHSNGRTITATVDAILAGSVAPDGTEVWKGEHDTNAIMNKLDYLERYLDKKFEELKSDLLVEEAAARSTGAPKKFQGEPTWVEWEQMQYIIFELLEDDAREWRISKGAIHQLKEGSSLDDASYTIRDGVIFIDDSPIITVSPRVQEAINDKKVYE